MKRKCDVIQLSLFDNDYRDKTDNQLISDLTNKVDMVSDMWEGQYRLERLFNSLTPQRRRIAVAAVELYKRREAGSRTVAAIRSSMDIYNIMQPIVGDLPNEEFWIIALNRPAKVIMKKRISVGGIDQTCADVRLIMRILIEAGAVQFAAVHNHPSGNIHPSNDDMKLTEQLKKAAEIFNIRLMDHVIVTAYNYYSFCDEGLI